MNRRRQLVVHLPLLSLLLSDLLSISTAFLVPQQLQEQQWYAHALPSSTTLWSSTASSSSLQPDFYELPFRSGTIDVSRNNGSSTYKLAYHLVRPMSLSSRQAAPIVVLHGGSATSVPSNYLYPLAQHVPYRSILFYDQLGCGLSDELTDEASYSIDNSIDDLEVLLNKLGVRRFHLYGQSFGGILGYEYLKRQASIEEPRNDGEGCLSVILSSTATDVSQVEAEANSLMKELDNDSSLFRETHQCRTATLPAPLVDAYAAATESTVSRGAEAVADYRAEPPDASAARLPSCLVLQGQYDFVTPPCTADWKTRIWNHQFVRERTLDGCSHHGLLENGSMYGEIVDSYFSEYD